MNELEPSTFLLTHSFRVDKPSSQKLIQSGGGITARAGTFPQDLLECKQPMQNGLLLSAHVSGNLFTKDSLILY